MATFVESLLKVVAKATILIEVAINFCKNESNNKIVMLAKSILEKRE